jgi:hypothetical protein
MAGGGIKQTNVTIRGGADGATFIPYVDQNGYLSWSNNKGYTNPETVKVKGEDGKAGEAGATGAKIISQVLSGQDEKGGNIYLQTFDDGTTAYFTAPRGEKGSDYTLTAEDKAEISNIVAQEIINPLEAIIDESGVLA